MIKITKKDLCCGCNACFNICPKHCITMQQDDEGFLYPVVDEAACIDCGVCEKVCHELHPYNECRPQKVYAAINKDETIRLQSSSGGIFFLLAEKTIREGGVVFGARFDEEWQVRLDYAETLEGVKPFMGSKYVQARTETSYKDAETFLKQGRKVLFSGTPCQIAGLHHYLRKEYDHLTTVDFVCHGVPSPKVWKLYLNEVIASTKKLGDINFRNKRNGWKKFNLVLTYDERENTTSISSWHRRNHYMQAFLQNLILRPSCYNCLTKSGRSHSDLTVADFWGVQLLLPEMDDDKGTGLLLVNTAKGESAIDFSKMKFESADFEFAIKHNGSIRTSVKPHHNRKLFFSRLNDADSIVELINYSLRLSAKEIFRKVLGKCKFMIKKMFNSHTGGVILIN